MEEFLSAEDLINKNDQERMLNYLVGLGKGGRKELMQAVEHYEKFKTPDQVNTAKELILRGYAIDAEGAYSLMVQAGLVEKTNDAWS